jgi:hypothetical protein
MIEHMDFASHQEGHDGEKKTEHAHNIVGGNHDDVQHQAEIKLYISLFAIVRLIIFTLQMYKERNVEELQEYMRTNWFEMIKPQTSADEESSSTDASELSPASKKYDIEDLGSEGNVSTESLKEQNIDALKLYVKKCSEWDAKRMNLLSISLLLICCFIDCVGKLWVNFLCLNFGALENVSSLFIDFAIASLSMPLFLDVSYLLLQRVHPKEVSQLVTHELQVVERKYAEEHFADERIEWHIWSLDKNYRIGTFKVTLKEHS